MQEHITYEQAMKQLEELASKMERCEIGIDEMADNLREAQQLIRYCRERLYGADEAVQKILGTEQMD